MGRAIIVCPLHFERQALVRAGLDVHGCVICVGPGAENVSRFVARERADADLFILAGLAGGLNPALRAGAARVISEVVDSAGSERWRPKKRVSDTFFRITSAEVALVHQSAKLAMRERTGADLVDLESVAFARACTERGVDWAIVRGVSDDATCDLPANIDQWVDDRGRARLQVVVGALARRPGMLRTILRLRAHGFEAMREVARQIERLLTPPTTPA